MRFAWLVLMAFACGCLGGNVDVGCDIAKEAVAKAAVDRLNFCSVKGDCSVEFFGCPFGCYSFVNRYSDLASASSMVGEYDKACPKCVYKCMRPPEDADIDCVQGVCVDLRYAPTTTVPLGVRGVVRGCRYTMEKSCRRCYCMEVGGDCRIVDWSGVGDLAGYVDRNVTYIAEDGVAGCTRMCPCQMRLMSIVAVEEPTTTTSAEESEDPPEGGQEAGGASPEGAFT